MKRTLLFVGFDVPVEHEIRDSLTERFTECLFARTAAEAIRVAEDRPVDCIILNFCTLNDAAMIRYFSRYHPGIQLVLSVSKEFDEAISIFNEGHYSRLPRPFRLEELREIL